ncbi:MAG: serine/threonine protein kinase [Labilithrix sp.]|nr:serine/threonine protein kinase [Labilithrix sp.]MCW5817293.1 serine/threonine protein kinase [Labilithrix sp.]
MGSASRYETIAEIGTGGMASVFLGRARGGDELVALKRAHPHIKRDPKAAESMLREANLAARVRHPNVVNVLDVDEDQGDLVIVLDYVEGCTLRTLFTRLERSGEWRPREMLRIVLDVAAGLEAAHRIGLIHRDVSPSNVLVGSDGIARLADFGLAKAQFESSDGERTATGILKGKLAYMAPEYIMYQRVDAASDLFSYAVVAWESLAGSRLFKGHSDIETLALIADANTLPLSSARRELRALDPIFTRALAKQPEDRFFSVAEMAAELEHIGRGYDLLASREEVADLVERVAEPEISERRRLARAEAPTMHHGALPLPPGMDVPDPEPSGDLPTQVHSARRVSLPPPSYPPASRTSRPPPHPSHPPSHPPPQPSRSAPPPTARARSRRNEQAEREANREHLALIGALLLLLLALVWMWSTMARDKARPPAVMQPAALDGGTSPAIAPVMPTTTPSQRGNTPRRPVR